ncbi:fimbrial protein [Paraburkholderia sp. LEh10]|uniref:fimbrial protein n=1 Tax=Paraburkholderia sp. LEh10 TaxID=2821353 RepID=UPI001AE1DD0F|nr:fimbrial protein [Paraburkholderia sp. LEh10]MBP0591324.1 fimbrial protein [Paraburkholderia sp. LEh10]
MRKLKLLLAMLAATAGARAFAIDATIYYSGEIAQPSCTVDTSSLNQTVNLGSATVMDFGAIGSTLNPTAFNVLLNSCGPGTKVTMTVNGTMDTVASVLQNTGTATQVGVQLLQATSSGATSGTPITLNSAINLGTVDATNAMTIPMVAQFYRLGSLTAGSVTAAATVNFTYN